MSQTLRLYGVLADLVLALHVGFVLFVVLGQLLIVAGWLRRWRWTRHFGLRALHLGAIAYVALQAWWGMACPLTVLENRLRALAGGGFYAESFIGYWLQRLLFYTAPAWVFTLVYTGSALLVLFTFLKYPPLRRRAARQISPQISPEISRDISPDS